MLILDVTDVSVASLTSQEVPVTRHKKKRYDSDTHSFHLLGKIKTIEDSLKNSFFNIKRDITKINGYLYHHDTSIEHLKTRISYLESHIRDLKSEKPIK